LFNQKNVFVKNKFGFGKNGKTKMILKLMSLKYQVFLKSNRLQPKLYFNFQMLNKLIGFLVQYKQKVKQQDS
jgi:hypothetical protein